MKSRYLMMFSLLIASFLTVSTANSAIWYVREGVGSDANAGTSIATAFATIQRAVNAAAVTGDEIRVARGIYQEQVHINEKSVTIRGGYMYDNTDSTVQTETEIRCPLWGTLASYSDATNLPAGVVGTVVESNTYRPVVYINTSTTGFQNNLYRLRINGNSQYSDVPATSHFFGGLVVRNSNGTCGGPGDDAVTVTGVRGSTVVNKKSNFGIFIFGRSQYTVQYTTVTEFQNAGIAVVGWSLSSLASTINAQPNPQILDNTVRGASTLAFGTFTQDRAGVLIAHGARTTTRRNIVCGVSNSGSGIGYACYIRDGRSNTIGDLTLKTNGNLLSSSEIGVGVTVTSLLIDPSSLYIIRNNNIVYNGNGASDVTTTGAARFENSSTAATSTLNLINNAWGNSAASTLYTEAAAATAAFWEVGAGDQINRIGALAAPVVFANLNLVDPNCTILDFGYGQFLTLQNAVNGVAPCGIINVAPGTYVENISINKCLTMNGDTTAGCPSKPIIRPASGVGIAIIPPAENVTINGMLIRRSNAGAATDFGLLSRSSSIAPTGVWPTNDSPRGIQVRNTCFQDFTNDSPAAMSTDDNGPTAGGLISGRTDVSTDYPSSRDIDASFNNILNYSTIISGIASILFERGDAPVNTRAEIIPPTIFAIACGDSIQPYINASSPGATLYIKGNCVYNENLNFNRAIYLDIDYTGTPLNGSILYGDHTFSSVGCGVGWYNDNTNPNKPRIRFADRTVATPGMPELINPAFGTPVPNTWFINNTAVATTCLQTAFDSLMPGGTVFFFTGAPTSYSVNLTINKPVTIGSAAALTQLGAGQQLNLGRLGTTPSVSDVSILNTGIYTGTFGAPTVNVNQTSTSLLGNSGAQSSQQGIRLATSCGVVNLISTANFPNATFGAHTPTIDKPLQFFQGSPGTAVVNNITLNGSGNCTACAGNPTVINQVSVDSVYMSNANDCITTALGTNGQQNIRGVGLLPAGVNRQGTIRFNASYGAAANENLTVDKDVRFSGANAVTNTGTLTLRLGAQGTEIAGSTNYCHSTTTNVTQLAGSTFTQIPDIDDGILLSCAGATINVGTVGAVTNWGGATNVWNNTSTINKSNLTIQGVNNAMSCAQDPAFVIDASTGWGNNPGRSANVTRFNNFTVTAGTPIWTITSGTNGITLRGFDFSFGAGSGACLSVPGASNNLTFTNNWLNQAASSANTLVDAATLATRRTTWNLSCNRVDGVSNSNNAMVFINDIDGLTLNRNQFNTSGSGSGRHVDVRGTINANITANVVSGARGSGVVVGSSGSNSAYGTITVLRNRISGNNVANLNPSGGLAINDVQNLAAAVGSLVVENNFIQNNLFAGIMVGDVLAGLVNNNNIRINWNCISGNTTGITMFNGAGNQTLNAQANSWGNISGPTSPYNPANTVPCTPLTFGDAVVYTNNTPNCANGVATRVNFIPWLQQGSCSDLDAATDGFQQNNSALIERVLRVNSSGVLQASTRLIQTGVIATAASDRVIPIQGDPSWSPTYDPVASDNWGDFFSETVTTAGRPAGIEIRGYTHVAVNGGTTTMFPTYLAHQSTQTLAVGNATLIGTTPATMNNGTGNGVTIASNSVTLRNMRIQGYRSPNPMNAGTIFEGAQVYVTSAAANPSIWYNELNGSASAANGSWAIVFDAPGGANFTIRGNQIGTRHDISAVTDGGQEGGVGIALIDGVIGGGAVALPNGTIGGSGTEPGGNRTDSNFIANCERVGVLLGENNLTSANQIAAGGITLDRNRISGVRDAAGLNSIAAVAAVYSEASGGTGTLTFNNNVFGSLPTSANNDNKVDVVFGNQSVLASWNVAGSINNRIWTSAQSVNSVNWLIEDSTNTFGSAFRTFFNPASGNTFTYCAMLTTEAASAAAPQTSPLFVPYVTAPARNLQALSRSNFADQGVLRLWRDINSPLQAAVTYPNTTVLGNTVEVRGGNVATQMYTEQLQFPDHAVMVLGEAAGGVVANVLAQAGGTGIAMTSTGDQNKFVRGLVRFNANGTGIYGRIGASASDADARGDIYLDDAALVTFAYNNLTVTGNANGTVKSTDIKAGLEDADDDGYVANGLHNGRRTGIFRRGAGTQFLRPVEPQTGGVASMLYAFPNPSFGATSTTVRYTVPTESYVTLALYNALGEKVGTIVEGSVSAGNFERELSLEGLSNGTYTIRMTYDIFSVSEPIVVVR